MGEPFQLGRYALHAELAAGGMAAVYLARQSGAVGFGKTVAIKRLHPHLAKDPYFATMFLDEARLVARVQHPNVVPILDVVATETELFLVLEYVRGETLSGLLRAVRKKGQKIPVPIAAAITIGLLAGLQAAHEARDETGKPLNIVHRDVSPQNLMVGADGVPRVLDFGVAKAASRLQTTREGQLKGKLPYMSPEQLSGEVTAQSDVYAAALVLWEALTTQRLFKGETEAQVLHLVMTMAAPAPSTLNPQVPAALDAVVLKGLEREPAKRWASAKQMAAAIEACVPVASAMKVAEWVDALIGPTLAARDAMRAEIESGSISVPSLPEPITSPSLPGFPQVDSSVSIPNVAADNAGLDGASTASLVVVAPQAPARSRLPLVIVALAAVGALGVVLAVTFARTGETAARPSATAAPPPVSAPSATTAAIVTVTAETPSPSASIAPAPPPSAVASTHHRIGPTKPPTHAASAATGTPNDINSLLDTR
jgi:eukaryotic-like serine/threonine-protein kinase